MQPAAAESSNWVSLNVGGTVFVTTRQTLQSEPQSMLARLIQGSVPSAKDANGAILIDRDPVYFRVLLNFLRSGHLCMDAGVSLDGIEREADFFGLENVLAEVRASARPDLTRSDVIRILRFRPRFGEAHDFRRLRLHRLDLSGLNLSECNFSQATLCHADFSRCDLENVAFLEVDAKKACFRNATMKRVMCNRAVLAEADLSRASLDSVNFLSCDLSDANMSGSSCQHTMFQNADLRGANLSNANLGDAKFQKADLRGANLTGALNLNTAHFKDADMRNAIVDFSCIESGFMYIKITQSQFDQIPDSVRKRKDVTWTVLEDNAPSGNVRSPCTSPLRLPREPSPVPVQPEAPPRSVRPPE